MRTKRGCSVDWCTDPHNAKGYCRTHYGSIVLKGGDPNPKKSARRFNAEAPEGFRYCPRCERYKEVAKYFSPNPARTKEWSQWCRDCINGSQRSRYHTDQQYREHQLKRASERLYQLKVDALVAYGGKCNCCGEAWTAFLQLDHVNNNGKQHREATSVVWKDLRDRGYPKTGEYQVLCANCHFVKTCGKLCPVGHQLNQL